jgi:hypothetical protein
MSKQLHTVDLLVLLLYKNDLTLWINKSYNVMLFLVLEGLCKLP